MSYPGGPPNGHGGYWNGHNPPNVPLYGMQGMHSQHPQNGAPMQHFQQHPHPHMGTYQNPHLHYVHGHGNMPAGRPMNRYDGPGQASPPAPTPAPAPVPASVPAPMQAPVHGNMPAEQPMNRYHGPGQASPPAPAPAPVPTPMPAPVRAQAPAPAPSPAQTSFQPSAFINPAQLFSQPPTHQPHHPIQQPHHISPSMSTMAPPALQSQLLQTSDPPVDRSLLLMSLAEEFFDAAHNVGPSASLSRTDDSVGSYEKLVATGLACLDAALRQARLPPRVEANIRLRYAGVLYEETENYMEAEIALSKGIALCDRNHYYDLKYAMQLLLAQFMFKKNPKASLKALDSYISNAEAYQHVSWIYALRFLRASHSLESSNLTDHHAALQNLRSIAKLAGDQNDRAIFIAASLMEAMAHLKSTGPESMEHAQRAIAAVWAYQLDNSSKIPQLLGLAHILDVACSLRQGNPAVMINKLKLMQTMMDEALRDSTWSTTSDVIAIPINRTENSSQVVSPDTRTILGIGDDGRDNLMLSFLNKKDAFSITYLLCGMVFFHRNSTSDRKGFKYLETGLNSLEADMRSPRMGSGVLPDCIATLQWRGQIMCYINCYMAFCAAAVTDWATTKSHIDRVQTTARDLDVSLIGPLGSVLVYLTGVYHQGTGDLDTALRIFQDKRFDLPSDTSKGSSMTSADQVERDIALLAALSSLWIQQEGQRKDLALNGSLISKLEPLCKNHANKDIETAFNLVMATVETHPSAPLFQVKNCLRAALTGAQTASNTQFLCITLSVMCNRFFSNVVGAQAEKSAQAASVQAQKSGNILWRSVADGMLAQCYEVNGKAADASYTMEQASKLAQMALPDF